MKVVVLIPSQASLATAGVRIRYLRLVDALADAGVSLVVTPIDSFNALDTDCNVAIVSKCYDARALIAAAVLSKRGISVGVDLFDDYFSEQQDSRLSGYRIWLRQMLRLSHFAMCSTPSMARVTAGYRDNIAVQILNDPAPAIDRDELAELLERKILRSRSGAALRVSWFGIGDNPYFPVGLSDVVAFRDAIAELALSGIPIELEILTNKRALDANGLALVQQLPIRSKIDLWSAEGERELLEQTDVCFLPVNAQPFSISKSLNRALTALASGCQVLSVGYPLYEPLGELVYRETASLISDWFRGEPRLRPSSLEILEAKIGEFASPALEAMRLADFLRRIVREAVVSRSSTDSIALLHGLATTQAAHQAVKAAGGLSIATSLCSQELDFDAIVTLTRDSRPSLLVSTETLPKLKIDSLRRRDPAIRIGGRKFVEILGDTPNQGRGEPLAALGLPTQIGLYEPLIELAVELISESFGARTILLSEESGLPVEPVI